MSETKVELPMPQNKNVQEYKYLKYVSLLLLVFQSSSAALLMRYVRTREGKIFEPTTAVVCTEVMKTIICMFVIAYYNGGLSGLLHDIHYHVITKYEDMLKMSIPSICYVAQNNLNYIAVSNLNVAIYQTLLQMKILTTAFFAVIMLKKKLSKMQIVSLLVLTVGCVFVNLQSSDEKVNRAQMFTHGISSVLIAVFLSGFSGVFTEMMLKHSNPSLWSRNFQMGIYGTVGGLLAILFKSDRAVIFEYGFFHGYTPYVWLVITLQALGGLLVASVMKYADNILKGFAAGCAIILSTFGSVILFDFSPDLLFFLGMLCVGFSTFLYSNYPHKPPTK